MWPHLLFWDVADTISTRNKKNSIQIASGEDYHEINPLHSKPE